MILRILPDFHFASAMPLRFDAAAVEEQLDQVIEEVESLTPWCLWVIGPSSHPIDLEPRFLARGFTVSMEWEGLILSDLSLSLPTTPGLVIEPLSWSNAELYAATAGPPGSPDHARLLAQAYRFLKHSPQEAHISLAFLEGKVAGFVVLRLEANGIAYFRNAVTIPEFRHRGVYLSLVAHRLALAKAAGCTAVVGQAQTRSTAPLLIKRGFIPVGRLVGLKRFRPHSAPASSLASGSPVISPANSPTRESSPRVR